MSKTGIVKKIEKVYNKLGTLDSKKMSIKKISRETPRATIVVNRSANLLQKAERDRNRFFKEAYEEEKRRLFFK